ncbi:hypothetical protein N032_28065 (plasmid) [Pseudomonas syringae pv. pisi str. PP1]|nr:hypothetical protein N032_28065 [Pseudomonas syringae pv. pisi str. PP1]
MTPSLRLGVWGSFTTPRTRGLGDPSGFTRAGPWCCSDLPCREHPCLPEARVSQAGESTRCCVKSDEVVDVLPSTFDV